MTLPGKNYLSIVNIIHTLEFLHLSTSNWQQVAVLYVSEGRSLTCPPISYNQKCQKQLSTGVLQNTCFEKFRKIHRNTLTKKPFLVVCRPRKVRKFAQKNLWLLFCCMFWETLHHNCNIEGVLLLHMFS